jgi:alpha-1,2-mannosyltransferase
VRLIVASSLGLAVGLFTFALGVGLTGAWLAGAAIGSISAGVVGWLFWRRPFVELDETACPRGLAIVAALAAVLAFAQLTRLTVFIVAPSHTDCAQFPSSKMEVDHSCVSAYYVAAASDSPNVYDPALYNAPDDNPARLRKPKKLGRFNVDVYEYPPPFLPLPRGLQLLAPEFVPFRMVWFGLNGLALLAAFVLVARSLGPAVGTRALLLSPLVLVAIPTISFLEKGNVQGAMIALAMIAMVLFERRRWALGGAFLAYATVSKLFPGMLLVYLLVRRQWRAVAWTAAFGAVLTLLSLLLMGMPAYAAFLEHLPGLVGGEAFPAFRNPAAMAINYSVPGLVFKLKLFGVPGMGFGASKVVGWLYMIVAVAATYLLGKRSLPDQDKPLVWLAILTVATLRSPFLPHAYAGFPALWSMTLLAARAQPSARTLAFGLGACAVLNIYWPVDWPIDPRLLATITLFPQAAIMAIAFWVVWRALRYKSAPAV